MLFAVRKFKAPLGGQAKLRTDHHALPWLLNFKEPEGQVARPGRRHGNAEGLSGYECKLCGPRGIICQNLKKKQR